MQNLTLYELIEKFGNPDIIIDHYQESIGYAIWGFDDVIQQSDKINFYKLDQIIDKWSQCDNEISAVGFLNYNLKDYIYNHIHFKAHDNKFPLLWFVKPKKIIKYSINTSDNYSMYKNFTKLKHDILDVDEYKKVIEIIKNELAYGNVYQVNMTMPKFYQLKDESLKYYLHIRRQAKPKCGYYINLGKQQILSFSPETFFTLEDNTIKTYPMKGTIKRNQNKDQDQILKNQLGNSEKDLAEHLMIVDLMRNDLGKICNFGTVAVQDLFQVNTYSTVHQMESCVYGKLKSNIKFTDIIQALFPGGSVTGAPKESAMKIIDKIENYSRDIYTGSIGYIKQNNIMNFNIAIRTMMVDNLLAKYPIGGGIVWDSNYKDEWDEAQLKSKILNE